MSSPGAFLLMLGAILYSGVIGSYIFERYRVPDVLNLIGIGLILGPVLHLVQPGLLTPWMPYVGAIALGIILFEGGLDLDFDYIVTHFWLAAWLGTATFVLSAASVAFIYRGLTGAPWVSCAMIGSALGCVSSAVVLPVVARLHIPGELRAAANLEAVISDLWGVLIVLILLRVPAEGGVDLGHAFNAFMGAVSTAVLGGAAFGLFWLWALDRLRSSQFAYMMTLAAVFVLYGMIELVHGSAPMAALTFGVFMTNADKIAAIFGKEYKFTVDEGIRRFNTEISFFVRTFFFVYMGLVVSFAEFDAIALAAAGAAAGALLLVRRLVLAAERAAGGRVGESAQVFAALVPRGLTSAVLVSMTLQAKVPGGERFLVLTFAVILLTNFYMTWRLYSAEKSLAAA